MKKILFVLTLVSLEIQAGVIIDGIPASEFLAEGRTSIGYDTLSYAIKIGGGFIHYDCIGLMYDKNKDGWVDYNSDRCRKYWSQKILSVNPSFFDGMSFILSGNRVVGIKEKEENCKQLALNYENAFIKSERLEKENDSLLVLVFDLKKDTTTWSVFSKRELSECNKQKGFLRLRVDVLNDAIDSLKAEVEKLKNNLKKKKGTNNDNGSSRKDTDSDKKVSEATESRKTRRVNQEAENIRSIIESNNLEQILGNPYLVSVLYYSETFLAEISKKKNQISFQRKVMANIADDITEEFRLGYFAMLTQKLKEKTINKHMNTKQISPLTSFSFGHGNGDHLDAIDLFAKEGSPVYSMSNGIVVLVDNEWDQGGSSSVTSIYGGNTIIIFDPDKKEFYRYAHLESSGKSSIVQPGSVVAAGDRIGTLGHSGISASKPGHGQHLHFEINEFDEENSSMKALSVKEIKLRIKKTRG